MSFRSSAGCCVMTICQWATRNNSCKVGVVPPLTEKQQMIDPCCCCYCGCLCACCLLCAFAVWKVVTLILSHRKSPFLCVTAFKNVKPKTKTVKSLPVKSSPCSIRDPGSGIRDLEIEIFQIDRHNRSRSHLGLYTFHVQITDQLRKRLPALKIVRYWFDSSKQIAEELTASTVVSKRSRSEGKFHN